MKTDEKIESIEFNNQLRDTNPPKIVTEQRKLIRDIFNAEFRVTVTPTKTMGFGIFRWKFNL